jgi:hypothetical protein
MQCDRAQIHLNSLIDGERLPGVRQYGAVARHWLACPRCRAVARRLKRYRSFCRGLESPPSPTGLRARVLESLPALAPEGGALPRRLGRGAAGIGTASAAALLAAALFAWNGRGTNAMAARVAAAVQRANTWHLRGWRMENGRQIPWEVWGRRRPFFYREETGQKLVVDDGSERLETFPMGGERAMLAIRSASHRSPFDNRWVRFAEGERWWGVQPPSVRGDFLVFEGGGDAGMNGPGSVGHDYYYVNRGTWLPLRWEYVVQQSSEARGVLTQTLTAEYDRPIPPAVAAPRLSSFARVIDVRNAPAEVPNDTFTRSVGEIMARLEPVKVDPEGNILAHLRAWLGPVRLGIDTNGLGFDSERPAWSTFVDGHRHPWSILDDLRRPYVAARELRTGQDSRNMLHGEQILWFAPLEPLSEGAPLPRSLTVQLTVSAVGPVVSPYGGTGLVSSSFLSHDFEWTLHLPQQPALITARDYCAPPAERRVFYPEDVPFSVRLAFDRAIAYECQSDRENAIRWLRWGIDHSRPDSNYAQFLRSDLATEFNRARDHPSEQAVLREIVAVKERYPKTWGYYAQMARRGLPGADAGVRGAARRKER